MSKTIEIVAGPNGSGKSTFAEAYFLRTKGDTVFLNADLIASGMTSTKNFDGASFQAGRVLINEIRQRFKNSESFAFESTLSGRNWKNLLVEAKDSDYKIKIYFFFLSSVQQNIKRINSRVLMGGHNIPADVVKRRYPRCFSNFWDLYRPLADEWTVFENSKSQPLKIMDHVSFERMSLVQRRKFTKAFYKGDLNGIKKNLY